MSKPLMRRAALVLTLATGLVVAGCGGDDDDGGGDVESGASPEQVVEDFYAATADGDYATVCALFSTNTREEAEEQEGEDCETSAEEGLSGDETEEIARSVEVGEATIDGETATVEVTSTQEEGSGNVNLVQEDGEWRVDSFE